MPTMSVVIQNCVSHQLLGVATSARQFFMQIGNVLGVAVFGVVLATSYSHAFDDEVDPAVQERVAPSIVEEFEDPTLALDDRRFPAVIAAFDEVEGGEALLASALAAQKEGVATAIRHIYLGSTVLLAGALVLIVLLREIPLRRTFAQASAAPVAPAQPAPAPPVPTPPLASPAVVLEQPERAAQDP
jgi:hypothetical protein